MQKLYHFIFVVILILHGLIHLMGTIAYIQLGTFEELPYKTTLLNGSWDVGQTGIAIFGALWAVAALGFVLNAVAMLARWTWAQPALVAITLLSLVLTSLDWKVAYAGVILNIAILGLLWLGPHIGASFLAKEMVYEPNR